ncbi:MAG: hypothetical protein H6713_13745 [Myxococcales bacterium]|nr:hypothetical protein [Myxococcales bacterium]
MPGHERRVGEPRAPELRALLDARGVSALQQALRRLELLEQAELERALTPELVALLERRLRDTPELRGRVANTLYRRDPARLGVTLEAMVAALDQRPPGERDNLIHLYGCNPWSPAPQRHLLRWLDEGATSVRSEIVQSKYGLYFLDDALPRARFDALLDALLDDAPAIALGTLHWLHDHPDAARFAARARPRLAHSNPDIVFEALQLLRIAGHAPAPGELAPLLDPSRVGPRVASSAIELLELLPFEARVAPLAELLRRGGAEVLWATTRALLRGAEGLRAAPLIAARLAELPVDSPRFVELLRAMTGAPSFDHVAPTLACLEDPARVKALVSALQRALLAFDDPRLLAHARAHPDCHGLNPPPGFARFLARHGDPQRDRALVYGALGATDPRAGYEAMGVLARWGERALAEQLSRALGYPPAHADPALEAMFCALGSHDYELLAPVLRARARVADATLWAIFRELAARDAAGFGAWLRQTPDRARAARVFLEQQLRAEVPGKFVLGACGANHWVFARLDPEGHGAMIEATLGGTPDRFALDVLEDATRAPRAPAPTPSGCANQVTGASGSARGASFSAATPARREAARRELITRPARQIARDSSSARGARGPLRQAARASSSDHSARCSPRARRCAAAVSGSPATAACAPSGSSANTGVAARRTTRAPASRSAACTEARSSAVRCPKSHSCSAHASPACRRSSIAIRYIITRTSGQLEFWAWCAARSAAHVSPTQPSTAFSSASSSSPRRGVARTRGRAHWPPRHATSRATSRACRRSSSAAARTRLSSSAGAPAPASSRSSSVNACTEAASSWAARANQAVTGSGPWTPPRGSIDAWLRPSQASSSHSQ